MERDSRTESLWQSEATPPDFHPEIPEDEIFDVLIAGAGITGLTAGLCLQQSGKKCVIAEAKNIGFGTSSGTTAHLNTLLDLPYYDMIKKFGLQNARLMAKGAAEAITIVKANIKENNLSCDFESRNGVLFSENKKQSAYLDKIQKGLTDVDILSVYTDKIPVPLPFDKALLVPGQAQFNPLKYLYGMAEAFNRRGGQLIQEAPVSFDRVKDLAAYKLAYAGGTQIKCRNIVYATHIPPGLNRLHFECTAFRSYVLAARLADQTAYPDAVVYDLRDPYNYFRTAVLHNKKYLVAGGFDDKTGHKNEEAEEEAFLRLEAYLRKYFTIESVDYKWSSQFYEPVDGLPYIGQLPGEKPNTFVVTGLSGTGMTLGTLGGKIVSDLILSGDSEFKDLLSPSRIKPVAGLENFIKKNVKVVTHFIADRMSNEKIKALSEVDRQEGCIVTYNNTKVAIYKDEEGKIHALSPVCPHAKCIVQWNSGEKSWDCPCHGSRFNIEGAVLNGPAHKSLSRITLASL